MTKIIDIRNETPKRSTRAESRIKKIARHHSATLTGDFWSFWNGRWKGLGWLTGGYHEIIFPDGTVQLCYDSTVITNGVKDHNTVTYHICMVGNGSFTDAQEKAWEERCKLAMKRFGLKESDVLGHKEFSGQNTACPGIDMNKVRASLKGNKVEVKEEVIKEVVKPVVKGVQTSSQRVLRNVRPFMTGEDVKVVQRAVGAKVDGFYGDETERLVRAFQEQHNLMIDGIAGPQVFNAIKAGKKLSKPKYSRLLRVASPMMRGKDVEAVQTALGVAIDGWYGPVTEGAVKDFQRSQGISVDGIVGPQTWSKLF
ncbi:peptidoglycan recognition protein family protein [Halalkalibacter krulwichiae]|uniref:Autolysin n=1 Tax=Halalkalibacter krulwichiae TaxID=199441 RepID=A0A1X9MKD1_9BACI|nr:N-acetylmuramoyl-L-alanine amidase [Halalkalibacter krulwichiae]ARK32111.1 Autolytic lysozyme [Halalkalibacter krulwichiae]